MLQSFLPFPGPTVQEKGRGEESRAASVGSCISPSHRGVVTRSGDWRLLRPPPLFPPQYMSQDQACIDLGGMVCASSSSARTTIGACIIRVPLRSQDACSLSIFDDLISITPTTPCSCEGLRRQDGTGAVTLVQPNTLPCSIHPSLHTVITVHILPWYQTCVQPVASLHQPATNPFAY